MLMPTGDQSHNDSGRTPDALGRKLSVLEPSLSHLLKIEGGSWRSSGPLL